MALTKREVTTAAIVRITVLTAGRSAAVQLPSTSDALQRITPPLTIAAIAVIGWDILFLFANNKTKEVCAPQIKYKI